MKGGAHNSINVNVESRNALWNLDLRTTLYLRAISDQRICYKTNTFLPLRKRGTDIFMYVPIYRKKAFFKSQEDKIESDKF